MKFPFKLKSPEPVEVPPEPIEVRKDVATAVVNSPFDADAELTLSEILPVVSQLNPETQEWNLQLVSAGNVFSGVSIEDAIARGLGTESTYFDWYKATAVLRKSINLIASFTTRSGFETTVSCIDKDDDPENEIYQKVKAKIDEINRRVNLDNVFFISVIKRHLYGRVGWEIVTGNQSGKILALSPLRSSYVYPRIDNKTGQFLGVDYVANESYNIPPNRLIYFTLDTLENSETSWRGVSAVRSVEREIKIKKNLQRDLLYAARSLWAPIVIYQVDTRGLTPTEKNELFTNLQEDLRPGGIVVTNRSVETKVIQYNPDLNNLIRAIETQDQEIIGNFGIPKALLSREKTMARATLEFSIKAFYESTISQEQVYLKRQIERQWYDPLVALIGKQRGEFHNIHQKIRIRHEWKPIIQPESELIQALVKAYEAGVVTGEEFFRRLGWEIDRVEPSLKSPTLEQPQTPKGDENKSD